MLRKFNDVMDEDDEDGFSEMQKIFSDKLL
jgi:hypothetical protein